MFNKKLMLLLLILLVWLALPLGTILAQDEATPVVEVLPVNPGEDAMDEPAVLDDPGATLEITTRVQTIILSALAATVVTLTMFGSLFVMALRYVYKSIPQELREPVKETVLSSVEYAKDRVAQLTELPGEVDDELRRLIFKAVDERMKSVFEESAVKYPSLDYDPNKIAVG